MNYFDFYEIPVSFFPDEKLLQQRYYRLSKQYHPDFYANEPAEKQAEILELSTLNNKAYQTLSSFEKRLEHILEINNMLVEGEKYALSQAFLMEMLDINERLMDLEMDYDEQGLEAINTSVSALAKAIEAQIMEQGKGFESLSAVLQTQRLEQVKDAYYRKKYLLRIKDSLNKFAAR